jgi:transposase
MTLEELERQIEALAPQLGPEGKLLVELLMPFCRELHEENKRLRDKLGLNSRNSSKSPSQDIHRPVKKRPPEDPPARKPGGQKGHTGQGGKLKDNPDNIIPCTLTDCPECGKELTLEPLNEVIRRQIEAIPEIKTAVTEYRIEVKTCSGCGIQWQAGGCDLEHEFEYGANIKSLAVYLSAYQFLPQKRIQELLGVFGVQLSTGTLNNFRKSAAKRIEPFVQALKQKLIQAPAAHFDERGLKVGGVSYWVHVASTKLLSFFGIHRNRGQKAHQDMGILPSFSGIAHRDAYRSYDDYEKSRDSLCCAHLLRELQFAIERDNQQQWAQPMIELLLTIKKQEEARTDLKADKRWQGRHRKKYRELINQGLKMNPSAPRPKEQKKGATKQSKTHNLLIRFRDREDDILRFMEESMAEFTNNQAERDLRMNKVRAKISGGFRELTPAEEFMKIRSLISTAVKQSVCPLLTLSQVFIPGNIEFMKLVNPD